MRDLTGFQTTRKPGRTLKPGTRGAYTPAMTAPDQERLVASAPHLMRWKGPKARLWLTGTVLGAVVITDRRLLFLTGGTSGLAGQFVVLGEKVSGKTPTLDDVDLTQLSHEGSLEFPFDRITALEVKRRWDFASYLSLRGVDEAGNDVAFAFMPKFGMNPKKLRALVAAVEEQRAA